jgi:hypothetical protein
MSITSELLLVNLSLNTCFSYSIFSGLSLYKGRVVSGCAMKGYTWSEWSEALVPSVPVKEAQVPTYQAFPSIPLKSFIYAALSLFICDLFHNHIIALRFNVGMYLIRKNTFVWTVPFCSHHVCPHKNLLGHLCYAYLISLQPSNMLKTGSTRQ